MCFQDVSAPRDDARWQYEGVDSASQGVGMMLNTDFEVYYDIAVGSDGEPSCANPHDCVGSSSYSTASGYADVSKLLL